MSEQPDACNGFAPNAYPPEKLVPTPVKAASALKRLWLSCGDQDGLIHISQRTHVYLKERNAPHLWHVSQGAHDANLEGRPVPVFATNFSRKETRRNNDV